MASLTRATARRTLLLRTSRAWPIATSVALVLLTLGFAWRLQVQARDEHRAQVQAEAQELADDVDADVRGRLKALLRFANRWELHRGLTEEEFSADALAYVRDEPGFQALEWVDASFHVRWVVPLEGNAKALGLDLAKEEQRRRALEAAKLNDAPTMTAPIDLVQGGKGFLVYFPVFMHDEFQGFVLAVFRAQSWLDWVFTHRTNEQARAGLRTAVVVDGQLVHAEAGFAEAAGAPEEGQASRDLLGHHLTVRTRPTASFLAQRGDGMVVWVLVVGLALSQLAALLLRTAQLAWLRADQANAARDALETEVQVRQRTEVELARTLSRLDLATRVGGVGAWEWDPDAGTLTWSELTSTLLGLPVEAPAAYSAWRARVHPDDLDGVELALRTVLESGAPYQREYRIVWPSGEVRTLAAAGQLVEAPGFGRRLVGIIVDVTERERRARTLEEARRAAEAANQAKSEFLSNMSHELRTPLNGIIGMTQLLGLTELTEAQRDNLAAIKVSSDALLSLLNDILDLSWIESGKLVLERRDFSLRKSVAEVLTTQSSLIRQKGLVVQTELPPEVPDLLTGDQLRLKQVLLNLVGNAIKFTSQGAIRVAVKLAHQRDDVATLAFSVTDTGIGIAPEALARIFQPFVQADASTTRKFGGTGLGLAICTRLSALMGGRVWAESTPGVGSTFHLEVPFTVAKAPSKEAPPPAAKTAEPLPQWGGRPLRILLADDVALNLKVARQILELAGHAVVEAVNGQDAVTKWEQGGVDVVLMDVQMPVLNGIEATKQIRGREVTSGRHTPIIAVTARALRQEREEFLAQGFDGFVAKPLELQVLFAELQRCVVGRGSFASPHA